MLGSLVHDLIYTKRMGSKLVKLLKKGLGQVGFRVCSLEVSAVLINATLGLERQLKGLEH